MNLAFLPLAARTFATLGDSAAFAVLERIMRWRSSQQRRESVRGLAGAICELSIARLNDVSLDLAVCSQETSDRLIVVGLDERLNHQVALENASLVADEPQGLLVGQFPMDNQAIPDLMRQIRAFTREAALLYNVASAPVQQTRSDEIVRRLRGLARSNQYRWRSTEARQEFRKLLDQATTAPQVIDRDGEDVIVIGKDLLDSFSAPKSATELADYFERRPLEPLEQAVAIRLPASRELPDLE